MVRIGGPLLSLPAHGWLGRGTYGHRQYRKGVWVEPKGLVVNPYPIAQFGKIRFPYKIPNTGLRDRLFYFFGKVRYPYHIPAFGLRPYPGFISQYYSPLGWCYQLRRTWHGIVWSAIRPPISAQPNTFNQYVYKLVFADAVHAWQSLTPEEKKVYHYYRYPVHASGYNRFLRFYLKENYPMTALLPVYKQDWLQAEAVRAPTVNPATFQDLGITGVWQFADGLTKVIICKLPLVTDIDRTKDAFFYLGWSSPAQSKNCRWQVEYLLIKEDSDTSAVAEDTLTQTEASSGTANGLVISSFTIPGASIENDDKCILFKVSRLGGDPLDTLGEVANLIGVCLHYQSDKLGDPV